MAVLETLVGVPIARVGVWETSTGRWVCTAAQLQDAVRASRDPSFRVPVLKIGHTDPRFNDPDMDGEPAIGRLTNLRVDASGDVLLADLVGVPASLAGVLASAYPNRSVEALQGVVTATGNAYALVVTGLALLGETAPAIESLADVLALYEQPAGVDDYVAAKRLAASTTIEGAPMPTPRPVPVLASATIDELVSAAATYAMANGVEYAWVREVYTDRVIIASDSPPLGRLWELEWAEGTEGVTFTGPTPVKIEYTRLADSPVAAAAHTTIVPVRYLRGRGDVFASTPEEHPPVSDLAALVREQLGLPPDATDEAVTAALAERLGTGQAPPPAPPTPPAPATEPAPEPGVDHGGTNANQTAAAPTGVDLDALVAARVAAAVGPFEQKLAATSAELAARKEADRVTTRDALFASALTAGKITPAEVDGEDGWRAQYDASPEGAAAVTRMLSRVSAGTAVPTAPTAGASAGGPEPVGDGFTQAEYDRLFPDEKRRGASV